MAVLNGQQAKSVEATLNEYVAFCVSDNWLDDELAWMMEDNVYHDNFDESRSGVKSLDEQLDEWEQHEDGDDFDDDDDDEEDNAWMQSDDPWDHWGQSKDEIEVQERARRDISSRANEYLFDTDEKEVDEEESSRLEAEHLDRLSKITIDSRRLARARNNPKAKAFFGREPDALEGYDRLWASAIDSVCFKNLLGTFRNYGIEFADNFGDWKDGSIQDGLYSIEDVASFKARKVFEVTGLPCIASRTSFEIEPVPDLNTGALPGRSAIVNANPRVASGYRFNDIGMHVDYICEALLPVSEPHRVTRFKTCLCYYDGEMEVFDYGVCDVDLVFSNSMRTFIPMAQAINEMINTLQLTFGLEYQQWLTARVDESRAGIGGASMKLRDRVLKEGKVLPNDIIDVSAFMDSKVDVNLMDDCAKELASRFVALKPSKIVTVATTGLVIALPMAKYLQVPVVYARKERNIVMADTYTAAYSSKTVGKNRELLIAKAHLDEDDRVLIVDDFLSSGASQEALMRIIFDAGATAVGVGVLLEKVYDSGRQSLSGFDVPIHSLCRVASVENGVIQLVEEEGFDRMKMSSQK
jgi:xanthine phosphoribosyltransferase